MITHIINLSTSSIGTFSKWSKVTLLLKKISFDPIMPASYRPVKQWGSLRY